MDKIIFIKSKLTLCVAAISVLLFLGLTILIVTLSIIENMLWFLGLLIVPIGFIGVAVYLFFSELTNIEIDDKVIIEKYIISKKIKKVIKVSDVKMVEVVHHGVGGKQIYLYDKPKVDYSLLSKKIFNIPYTIERYDIIKAIISKIQSDNYTSDD